MFKIIENVKLEMNNILSFKGKITQQEMVYVMKEIEQIVSENAAQRNGSIVTATFDVQKDGGQPIMAVEILIPLNKAIAPPNGYTFKPVFRLNNAIKVIHQGNPSKLQESANELMKYVENKGLMAITPGYNITKNTPQSKENLEEFCAEIYVGVCDNIL